MSKSGVGGVWRGLYLRPLMAPSAGYTVKIRCYFTQPLNTFWSDKRLQQQNGAARLKLVRVINSSLAVKERIIKDKMSVFFNLYNFLLFFLPNFERLNDSHNLYNVIK